MAERLCVHPAMLKPVFYFKMKTGIMIALRSVDFFYEIEDGPKFIICL